MRGLNKSIHRLEVGSTLDLDAFLHPGRAFAHPMDVVRDDDLAIYEKRAILASWASDACAIEAAPDLRINASGNIVRFDDVMDALRLLDEAGESASTGKRLRTRHRAGLLRWSRRSSDDGGCALN